MCIGGPHRGLPYAPHPQRGWLKKNKKFMGPGIFDQKYCPNQLNVRLHLKFLNLNLSQVKENIFPKSKRRSKCGVVVGVFGLGPKGRG